jgi:hypothetical protein
MESLPCGHVYADPVAVGVKLVVFPVKNTVDTRTDIYKGSIYGMALLHKVDNSLCHLFETGQRFGFGNSGAFACHMIENILNGIAFRVNTDGHIVIGGRCNIVGNKIVL